MVALLNHFVGRTFFQELPLPLASFGWAAEMLIPQTYRKVPILVRTQTLRRDLLDAGFSQDNVHVVHTGLDHGTYRLGRRNATVPTVIFVGPVKQYKHPEVVLKVAAELVGEFPDVHLDVIGRDRRGLGQELKGPARKLNISILQNSAGQHRRRALPAFFRARKVLEADPTRRTVTSRNLTRM